MQQLDIFTVEQPVTKTGFKYRRRLYNKKNQYLYTVIPTADGYTLNRVQSLAENIGLLSVGHEEYEQFKEERGLIERFPQDVAERLFLLSPHRTPSQVKYSDYKETSAYP